MGTATRVLSLFAVAILLMLAFQPATVEAGGPADPENVNYALSAHGGSASAATWASGYEPSRSIDGTTGTAWWATANDALTVTFGRERDLREVHLHQTDYAMPEVDLYYQDAAGSLVLLTSWSENTATTLIHAVSGGVAAHGVRVSFPSPLTHTHSYIHTHTECTSWHWHDGGPTPVGGGRLAGASPSGYWHCHAYSHTDHVHYYDETHYAHVAELEAWGDDLPDAYEEAWWYRQGVAVVGTPVAIPDTGGDVLVLGVERPLWSGVDTRALLDLEVDHTTVGDLAVAVGFWNGAAWDDRLVWVPGAFANASIWDPAGATHTHTECTSWHYHSDGGPTPVGTKPLATTSGGYWHCHAYETYQETHYYEAQPVSGGEGAVLTLEATTSPTTSSSTASGSVSHVVIDLRKAVLEAWEQDAGFRTVQFAASDLQGRSAWRVLIRDWNPFGGTGSVLSAAFVTEERSSRALGDTDGDGLADGDEVALGTFPVASDTDWDGLTDRFERDPQPLTLTLDGSPVTRTVQTDPLRWDTDGDGLSDGEEREPGLDGAVTDPTVVDTDGDTLGDGDEVLVHRSDPTRKDTDGDSFADNVEVSPRSLALTVNGVSETRSVTTLPYAEDSDGDGLTDYEEWHGTSAYGVVTDPSDPDTDGDGLPDGQERFTVETSLDKKHPIGTYVSKYLSASLSGQLESAAIRYSTSGVDAYYLRIKLTHAAKTLTLRDHAGSGPYLTASADLTGQFSYYTGSYLLEVWSDVSGGLLEDATLSFTVLTSPIKADTDGDGLSDQEEVTHGSDGWITDPNRRDTDGDGWSDGYEVLTKGTSPVSKDTDGDGAADPDDVNPLRNLLVKVKVKQAHHGGAWWDPELAVVVRVNDDYSWVTQHEMGSADGSDDHTASFYYSYHADVPDDVSTVSVRATAWSFNWRGDDLIEDGTVSYTLNSGLQSYTISGGASWITIDVSTVALGKARTLLVTDGNVTVEASNGKTRMAASDRFVVVTLDVTSASSPFAVGVNTVLVPRSLFLESKLKADFDASSYAPLATATFYGEDLAAAEVSEGVAGLIAGTLTGSQASGVLDRLLRNSTNVEVFEYVDITSQAVVATLPYDVVRILPWTPVSNGPTGAVPQGFWEKIGAGATQAVNVLLVAGQLVLKGLVALGTFLIDLAEAIWDWGMQAAGEVQGAAQAAIDKVGEVFWSMVAWVEWFITDVLAAPINAMMALMDAWLAEVGRVMDLIFDPEGSQLTADAAMASLQSVLFSPGFWSVLLGVSIAIQALEGLLIGLTVGTGAGGLILLVASLLSGELKGAVTKALLVGLGVGIATFAGVLIYETLFPGGHPILDTPVAAVGMTVGTFLVFIIQELWLLQTPEGAIWPGVADIVGWAISALGFLIAWQVPGLVANDLVVTAVGAALAGLGLGIAVIFDSPLDVPPMGYLDEGVDAAFFGFSVASVVAEAVG